MKRIGNLEEVIALPDSLPRKVKHKLNEVICILDLAYGWDRDYLCTGGYCLLAESEEDLTELRTIIDLEEDPCEWVYEISGYLTALYLLGDDFSVVVFIPASIAPKTLSERLEDKQ